MSTYSGSGEMERDELVETLEAAGLDPEERLRDRLKNAVTGRWSVTVETEEYEAHFYPHSYTITTDEEGTTGSLPDELQAIKKRYTEGADPDSGVGVR